MLLVACTTAGHADDSDVNIHTDGFAAHYTRHVSEHFVLVTHAHEDLARARLELLEKTYERFYDAFEDFDPQPTDKRLIAVLFDRHDAYVQYATSADQIDMSWSNGYYSARTNRVALVLARDERLEARALVHADTASREDLLPYAESTAAKATTLADEALRAHEARQVDATARTRLMVSMRPISIASTAHEAAHQIAFNSGLQQRGVMYPLWLSEGLATCFEPQSLDEAFGPEHVNESRRRDLVEAIDAGSVIPLEEFVSLTRLPTNDPRAVTRVYAQGWALFHFLYEHHPQALRRYMATLAELRPGRRTTTKMRAEFIAAFGPIHTLEAQWRQTLRNHRTALRESEAAQVALDVREAE